LTWYNIYITLVSTTIIKGVNMENSEVNIFDLFGDIPELKEALAEIEKLEPLEQFNFKEI